MTQRLAGPWLKVLTATSSSLPVADNSTLKQVFQKGLITITYPGIQTGHVYYSAEGRGRRRECS